MIPATAYLLHTSLLRSARHRAAQFADASRDVQLNADQAEYAADCAADARRDARRHLAAARRFKLTAEFNAHGMMRGRQIDRALGVVQS